MSQELQFTLLEERESAHVLAFYQTLYPQLGWTERTLKWQYFENPAGIAKVWVARDGDRVVSTYAAVPHRVYADGRVGTGWRIQDVLTSPDYRGRGIYNEMSKRAVEALFQPAYPVNFAFPNEHSHNALIRTGWQAAFRLPLRTRTDVATLTPRAVTSAVSIARFEGRHEDIWHRHRRSVRFAVERTPDYLNWRYVSHPKCKYFAVELTEDADSAILVLKYYDREDGSRWSHLCELFHTSNNPSILQNAMDYWINFTLGHGCQAMSCWSPAGTALDGLLHERGFSTVPDYIRWCLLNANVPETAGVLDERQWYLSLGDSDVF
ncbi:MAG TPA: GNAT family N-acetyltransferase [Vicinamibacterales bacterium]|nr:GNAT family N-acetyltransferase [Vicinamibacterales bacterium]